MRLIMSCLVFLAAMLVVLMSLGVPECVIVVLRALPVILSTPVVELVRFTKIPEASHVEEWCVGSTSTPTLNQALFIVVTLPAVIAMTVEPSVGQDRNRADHEVVDYQEPVYFSCVTHFLVPHSDAGLQMVYAQQRPQAITALTPVQRCT